MMDEFAAESFSPCKEWMPRNGFAPVFDEPASQARDLAVFSVEIFHSSGDCFLAFISCASCMILTVCPFCS